MNANSLPIDAILPDVLRTLCVHNRLVLEAPPGAGKTTRVPLALLDAGWLGTQRIVMLEPRRVAARSAAAFMAGALGEQPGERVGYRIRFEHKISVRTRIEVVTEGILTRMLQDDPTLEGIGALIFDEFHERHLSADLGLALALDVQTQLRDDLRIVVMSATLDTAALYDYLKAPLLRSRGREHPVDIQHLPSRKGETLERHVGRAVDHALRQHSGDILVFLPGQREIARTQRALEQQLTAPFIEIAALHGDLPVERQAQVLQPGSERIRRIVLATNVAESSVTLPGVRTVIDSGLAREPRFDANSGFSRLETVLISKASADQRAGRAGRVAAGWAYRLWPVSQHLEAQRRPEIAQVDLSGLALEFAAWGSDALRLLDPPSPGSLAAGRELLQQLGAVDSGGFITDLGRRMLHLGAHPRWAAMLLSSGQNQALACDLTALLEHRDPLPDGNDDLASRWRALAAFRQGQEPRGRMTWWAIDNAARQWRKRLKCRMEPPAAIDAHRLGDVLLYAFPDRIAAQHPQDPRRYQLANGRTAQLLEDSVLFGEPWLVINELRHRAQDALVFRGCAVDEKAIRGAYPARFVETEITRWDVAKGALIATRESRFDRIVLNCKPSKPDPAQATQALVTAVRDSRLTLLPWTDALRQWLARVQSLRHWMPDLAFPDFSETALLTSLSEWLQPMFIGKTRLSALSADALHAALQSRLAWNQRQAVESLTPSRVQVPSGMQRSVVYGMEADEIPRSPILAVKLQELFGLADTPRIVGGRVPLTLHLLSPAGRPLQVTQDLHSFWERTYPQVKKEMKGRYPKHPWPDDPWNAPATHRVKPRS